MFWSLPSLAIFIPKNIISYTLILFLASFTILITNKLVRSFPACDHGFLLTWFFHFHWHFSSPKDWNMMCPFLATYVLFYFFYAWSTFSNNDSWSWATNSILDTICKSISFRTTWSSTTYVKLLSWLSMVNLGVLPVRIMCVEYLVLLWISQRYPNKILGTWTSHFYMLVEETIVRPCFRVLIILSIVVLMWSSVLICNPNFFSHQIKFSHPFLAIINEYLF
jgi:hypothetical protein